MHARAIRKFLRCIYQMKRSFKSWLSVPLLVTLLPACDPVSLTVFGVGTAAGVQHTLGGIAYRTFSAPLPRVQSAVMTAFQNMAIKVDSTEPMENGRQIKARTTDREIEIELESISPRTTRMRSTVRNGMFMDAATATEIIFQTERALGG